MTTEARVVGLSSLFIGVIAIFGIVITVEILKVVFIAAMIRFRSP